MYLYCFHFLCNLDSFVFLQAVFFYAPSRVWRALNSKSGVDSDNIIECAHRLRSMQTDDKRASLLVLIRNQMHFFVSNQRMIRDHSLTGLLRRIKSLACSLWSGSYLVMLYLFVKLLYVLNILAQLLALSFVLKTDFSLFGLDRFMSEEEAETRDEEFLNNRVFPKVTMCDIVIRVLGNNQR